MFAITNINQLSREWIQSGISRPRGVNSPQLIHYISIRQHIAISYVYHTKELKEPYIEIQSQVAYRNVMKKEKSSNLKQLLPHLGSNQEPPEPKSDALSIEL